MVLPEAFYARSTVKVARELLGKIVVTRSRGKVTAGRIVETEAYVGDDPAAHSARGRTRRAEVMFGPPGRAYVYFIYGNHEMLNFVTERDGEAGAVLIRALEPVEGIDVMKRRRGSPDLTRGPGKLCRALGIRRSHNRASLQGPAISVIDDGHVVSGVACSPRVGISKAQDRYWRFFVDGHADVSRAPENKRSRRLS